MASDLCAISKFSSLLCSRQVVRSNGVDRNQVKVSKSYLCSDRRLTTITTAYISSLSASAVSSTLAPCHSAPYSPSQILTRPLSPPSNRLTFVVRGVFTLSAFTGDVGTQAQECKQRKKPPKHWNRNLGVPFSSAQVHS